MYLEQCLVRERHREWIKRAEQERAGQRIAELRRLEKQQERAERRLLHLWQRVERLRSVMSSG